MTFKKGLTESKRKKKISQYLDLPNLTQYKIHTKDIVPICKHDACFYRIIPQPSVRP